MSPDITSYSLSLFSPHSNDIRYFHHELHLLLLTYISCFLLSTFLWVCASICFQPIYFLYVQSATKHIQCIIILIIFSVIRLPFDFSIDSRCLVKFSTFSFIFFFIWIMINILVWQLYYPDSLGSVSASCLPFWFSLFGPASWNVFQKKFFFSYN